MVASRALKPHGRFPDTEVTAAEPSVGFPFLFPSALTLAGPVARARARPRSPMSRASWEPARYPVGNRTTSSDLLPLGST
jgi:hypothetical protein